MTEEDIKEILDDRTIPHLDFDRCFVYQAEEGFRRYIFIIKNGQKTVATLRISIEDLLDLSEELAKQDPSNEALSKLKESLLFFKLSGE